MAALPIIGNAGYAETRYTEVGRRYFNERMFTMGSISRREFLKNGALGLAGCTLALSFVGCQSSRTTQDGYLRFIHVTDTHLDLGKPKTVTWVEMLVDKINREFSSVDFVVFGGDNFNNNVPGNIDALKFK